MLVCEVGIEQLVEVLVGLAVRLVVDAQPALFLHGLALVVELGLRDLQRAHAIGFQEQRQLELIRRQHLEVQRQVVAGGAVHRAAVGEHLVEVLAVADVARALEHHVLEQVREAGAARPLVARADVVGDVDRDHRRAVVLDELHAQAVGERDFLELDADAGRPSAGGGFAGWDFGSAAPAVTAAARQTQTPAQTARFMARFMEGTQGRRKSGRGYTSGRSRIAPACRSGFSPTAPSG